MHPAISSADLNVLICQTRSAAHRLHHKLMLPAVDLDDLSQDLLVDLLRRLPSYDSARGSIGAFANIVLRHKSSRIAIQHHRQLRTRGGTMLSLDLPIAGKIEPLGDTLTEADGLAAWHGQHRYAAEDAEIRHDLARALGSLPDNVRSFCAELCTFTIAELAGRGAVSRSTLYRRIEQIRLDLAMRGVGSSCDTFQAS